MVGLDCCFGCCCFGCCLGWGSFLPCAGAGDGCCSLITCAGAGALVPAVTVMGCDGVGTGVGNHGWFLRFDVGCCSWTLGSVFWTLSLVAAAAGTGAVIAVFWWTTVIGPDCCCCGAPAAPYA